ncbi:unnamed protein product [Ilex paraguariensis]|uniref:Salicylate carboxymethyltransferase n=1 Tax=Ilex paraguariensis TaxID=185542 RepID=A0ABC8S543_9AQUA
MASTSPPSVLKAYYEQFQRDFSLFLKCRSKELVTGGRMVLTFLGRKSEDPSSEECCYIWELLAITLNDMVSEGLIEEEKLDSFNIPQYTPSPTEVKSEVEMEGSFGIDRLKVSEVNWNAYDNELFASDSYKNGAYNVTKCMRDVAEPLLLNHFGATIINEVFCRYKKIVADRMSKERIEFINVTIAMTKKGKKKDPLGMTDLFSRPSHGKAEYGPYTQIMARSAAHCIGYWSSGLVAFLKKANNRIVA